MAPGVEREPVAASRKSTRRVNARYLLVSLSVLILLALGLLLLKSVQSGRVRADALAKIRALVDEGRGSLALQHLDQYLTMAPEDIEALEIQAELLAAAARTPEQLLQAAQVNARLLRLDPDGSDRDATRRRLVRLYVVYSDFYRASTLFRDAPEMATRELRYRAAETIARQVVAAAPNDPEAHRLLGMALEGLAGPNNLEARAKVAAQYEKALELDPGDLEAADRLARLLTERPDLAAAEQVLDALVAARPDAPEARLIRYHHFQQIRQPDRAAAEIQAATRLAPENLMVRLAAAQDALQRGDPAAARRHLAALDPEQRDDLRVRMLNGLIDFTEDRPQDAIAEWRQGLRTSQGTSADLSWWLAYSLLRLNRVAEAEPLLSQYRRLTGDESDPRLLLLQALREESAGRPAQAIAILNRLEPKLNGPFREKLYLALGRCQQALGHQSEALQAFRQATRNAAAGSVQPWLTLAQTLMANDPDAAINAIEEGLAQTPDEPDLLIALASTQLRRQTALPRAQRRWEAFDAALDRAAKAAPNSAAVALMKADRLALDGRVEEAVALLEQAHAHNPRDTRLWVARAEGLSRLGRPDEAIALLERAADPKAAGDSAVIRLVRARLLLAAGRGREAREVLSHDLDRLAKDQQPPVLEALGQFAASQGDADAARAAYDAWARLRPQDPKPLVAALDLALSLGDEARLPDLLEALRRLGGPDDPTYLAARAEILLRTSDDRADEALPVVEQLLKQAPDLPIAHLLRGRILDRQDRTDEALAAYRRAWEGGTTAAYAPLAALLARAGRYDELLALQRSDRAFQLGGLAALASWQAGDRDQAARFIALAVEARPEGLDVGPWQAHLLDALGRDEDAEAALRSRAESQPSVAEPWITLIRFQAEHGRLDAARQTAETARQQIQTERPELLEAQCLLALRDFVGTDKALEAALQRWPDDPEVHVAAAQYYQETSRQDRATEHLSRALELKPGDRDIARELALRLSRQGADWERAWTLVGPDVPDAKTPKDRLVRAIVLARDPRSDRSAEAIAAIEALLTDLPPTHPTAATARDYLTRTFLNTGQLEQAVQISAVSAKSGSNPAAILLYAEALIRDRRFALAEHQLDRFALVLPGDARAARLRALLIRDRAGTAKAPDALAQAVADAGQTPQAEPLGRTAFALLLAMGSDGLDAADRIGRLLAKENPALGWMPAKVAALRGQTAEALALAARAIAVADGDDLGKAARIASNAASDPEATPEIIRDGAAALQTALSRDPDSPMLLLISALFHHQQTHYEREAALYRQILNGRPEGDPEGDKILNNLAWALSEGLGQPAEALKTIEPVLNRHPNSPQFLATRGVILIRLQQFDRAIADLQAAIAIESNPVRQYHLARAYRAAGQEAKFREHLQKARNDGLSLDMADPTERDELAALLQN